MALFGDLALTVGDGYGNHVADKVIGSWSARRLEHPPGVINTYEVQVEFLDQQGRTHEISGTIEHYYGDGALVLAGKVLSWAGQELANRDHP